MITVCSTVPPFAVLADEPEYAFSWLSNAEAVMNDADDEVRYFCCIETDSRGLGPFEGLIERLRQIDGTFYQFSFDDGSETIHTHNRLIRITTAQNICSHYSMKEGAGHELFLAADTRVPDDCLPRMLELDHPVVGLDIPTYCLDGPRVARYPLWDVRQHMASAACILRQRSVFNRLRWRVDLDRGFSDDPAMHADCNELLGIPTYVRHDVRAWHYPESIGPVESRHPAANMKVHR